MATSWSQLVYRALEERGMEPRPLFREAGLDPEALYDPGARYSFERIQELWRIVVATTGDPEFGLPAARCWHPTSWHALGYAWLASATLRDGFERNSRYWRLLSDAVVMSLEPSPRGAWIIGRPKPELPEIARAPQDMAMATIVSMCRLSCGPHFRPLRVRFKYPRPDDVNALVDFFQAPCEFAKTDVGFEVSASDLDARLPAGNSDLARANERVIRDYLARFDANTLAQRVRTTLLEQLPSAHACETSVAHAFNMTARTLQRRLRAERTSYKQILDDVRRELAVDYVSEPDLSIKEITYMLGFSEPSNFTRAFKRWTGRSPNAYRAVPKSGGRRLAGARV
jgi:AraC-like DNA-binding protein